MKIFRYIVLALLLSTTACDSWLDIKPEDRIEEDDLLKNAEGVYRALNGVYLGLLDRALYGESLTYGTLDIMGQLYNIEGGNTSKHFYKWVAYWDYKQPLVKISYNDIWKAAYAKIANINNLLVKTIPLKDQFEVAEYNQIRGELYALRAFLHFDMYRMFGPMNYATTKDSKAIPYYTKQTNQPEPISTAEEVMAYVTNDLTIAENLLIDDELFADTDNYLRRYRMNYFAVRALQARVALFKGDTKMAYQMALELVGTGGGLANYVSEIFPWDKARKNSMLSDEVLFGMQNSRRESIQPDFFATTNKIDEYLGVTKKHLEKLFPQAGASKDLRKESFISALGKYEVEFLKYRIDENDGYATTNRMHPLIRKSELVLILAETAQTREEKIEWLDFLYMNRGFQSREVELLIGESSVDDFIKDEYMREFFGEGQYFYFLKRKGIDQVVSQNSGTSYEMGATQYVVPLPDSEINFRD